MALTRLDNLYSSKTGRYLYVSPDDFNATDALDNRGNSPLRPFKTIQRAFIEVSRYSYVPGSGNDRFDQFSIMLMPGNHYIDNRPGLVTIGAGSSTAQKDRFFDASNSITLNKEFIAREAYDRMLSNNIGFTTPTGDSQDCIDDVFDILDAITYNLKYGGNDQVYDAANLYVQGAHVAGEESQTIEVFEAARDVAISVMRNEAVTVQGSHGLTQTFDYSIQEPTPAEDPVCADVASAIQTLFAVLLQAVAVNGDLVGIDRTPAPNTDEIPVFGFDQLQNEWTDNTSLDLSDPNNALYKFNATTGGAIVPRGCSLVGYDLRRTIVRPLYVPNPADGEVGRTSMFNLTGGCYLWQFTIKDGDLSSNSPLFDSVDNVGKVYSQKENAAESKLTPEYSHHKICIMEYADNDELELYYRKVATAFQEYQPTIDDEGEFEELVQENRIVGPLSDSRSIEKIRITNTSNSSSVVTVTTKIDHGYYEGQYVAILNTGLDEEINGSQKVSISQSDSRVFTYTFQKTAESIGQVNGADVTTSGDLSLNAIALAEIDSVESSSPYVFNCSIRSTWGQCGMWANGAKATGFKSMVVAQYTGVSLQKDDRAFIRYDRFTNTWNQASLTDAFATVPYHTKGDAYWKDDWKNFHIRASEDAFIQCVSVFAVGFSDHFLMESGGDMSITNSNSNFGNTSLHAIGHKGYSFNQDKGGYITHIIPPKKVDPTVQERIQYYALDILLSGTEANDSRAYIGTDIAKDPDNIPATSVSGFRIGSKSGERIYFKDAGSEYSAPLSPTGFKQYKASLQFFNPPILSSTSVDNKAQDAANLITANKDFIAEEAYAYILDEEPGLLTNPNINIGKCKRDIGFVLDAVITDLKLTRDTSDIPVTGGTPEEFSETSNINVIQAAESYFVGNSLDYIDNELTETLKAYDYVKNLAIAAMRNWDYKQNGCIVTQNSDTVQVPSTVGLVVGMTVTQDGAGTTPLQSDTKIEAIIDDQNIRIDKIAISNNTNSTLLFELEQGYYSTGIDIVSDSTITQDNPVDANGAELPECYGIANLIQSYFADIATILGGGTTTVSTFVDGVVNASTTVVLDTTAGIFAGMEVTGGNLGSGVTVSSVTDGVTLELSEAVSLADDVNLTFTKSITVNRREPTIEYGALAQRATAFVIDTGSQTSNNHGFETGTPVRLVPRAKDGTNPDKRLIRLPSGFSPNQKYYVIAPGRSTQPHDYSGSDFTRSETQKLLLATSKENAYAGIYIYSPETEAVDTNVEIDVYQYVLDDKYDLHKYQCNLAQTGGNSFLETNSAHHFHDPSVESLVQEIFFDGDTLPTVSSANVDQTFEKNTIYYAKYYKDPAGSNTDKQVKFQVYRNAANATTGTSPIVFDSDGSNYFVYANKKESPIKFDAVIEDPDSGVKGNWYINISPSIDLAASNSFFAKLKELKEQSQRFTSDSWYTRVSDERTKEDRVYRLRYVIPKYLQSVRDPLNGFVIKARTDTTRNLVAQKITVQSTAGGGVNADSLLTALGLGTESSTYDAESPDQLTKYVLSDSEFRYKIRSGRKIDSNQIELLVYDHEVNPELKGNRFTVAKVNAPQNNTNFTEGAVINWTGNSSGTAEVHKFITHSTNAGSEYYVVLKNTQGSLKYNQLINTTLYQGNAEVITDNVYATLVAKPDSIGDSNGESKSDRDDYLYATEGSPIFTAIPGDSISISLNNGESVSIQNLVITSVEDIEEIDDTFYIFDIDTIQERIYNQQDGVYYLTCVRGNISPYPQGAGVGGNFKNYKFPQPISQLYPLNYKNDPLWFQVDSTGFRDDSIVDPPATVSAADNYIHGLVTVNDAKSSETKESTLDLLKNLNQDSNYEITVGQDFEIIKAQDGNATSGSEDRKIPIAGNETSADYQKLYVELRRPSIARSGNHTFEYLGFGPGNYSTGFPARQEVLLQDIQDFYAQAKREDGGIVFYTGLNSNGDLYIGNRKINAITGEETFLESAELVDSEDEGGDIGSLVTTFDTAVRFEDKITVEGKAFFNNEVEINVLPGDGEALRIFSNIPESGDASIARNSYPLPLKGDIVLTQNQINSAIFAFNPRGTSGSPGQNYTIRTHVNNLYSPSNQTPTNNITFGNSSPYAGDILLKGSQVGNSGSLGWIYANSYEDKKNDTLQLKSFGTTTYVRLLWNDGITNADLKINKGDTIKITGLSDLVNGIWTISSNIISAVEDGVEGGVNLYRDNFQSLSYVYIQVDVTFTEDLVFTPSNDANAKIEVSRNTWQEFGVLGSESIRSNVDNIGDYRIGINTIARTSGDDDADLTSYVTSSTHPKANLDVVGNAYISGKSLNYTDSTKATLTDALLVGYDELSDINQEGLQTVLRVSTQALFGNDGRVGVNTDKNALDRNFVVQGTSRFSGNVLIESDLNVDGGDIKSTASNFNFLSTTDTDGTVTIASNATKVDIGTVGSTVDSLVTSELNLGTVVDSSVSKVNIGGGYDNVAVTGNSLTTLRTRFTEVFGDIDFGTSNVGISSETDLTSSSRTVNLLSNSGGPSTVNFARNAAEVNISGQGGTTTINNGLNVAASSKFDASIQLCGGLQSFSFKGYRGRMQSVLTTHGSGANPDGTFTPNVDLLNVANVTQGQDGYNIADFAGGSDWGSTAYQAARTITVNGVNQTLPALTGDEYYLPLKYSTLRSNGLPYISAGDIVLLDSPTGGAWNAETAHPEFLEVVSVLTDASPYYLKVKRKPFGNISGTVANHPDEDAQSIPPYYPHVYKVNIQFNATWIDVPVTTDNENITDIYLAEFGGSLTSNVDYIIVSRDEATNSGEIIKVGDPIQQDAYQFRVSDGTDCDNPLKDVFTVDSTNGDTYVKGNLQIDSSISILGGCGRNPRTFYGDIPQDDEFLYEYITNISNADIAKIKIGDTVDTLGFVENCIVAEIDDYQDQTKNRIRVSPGLSANGPETNRLFTLSENENFVIEDGLSNPSLFFDTCTSGLSIGNQIRRLKVSRLLQTATLSSETAAETSARYANSISDIRVMSYITDPRVMNGGKEAILSAIPLLPEGYAANVMALPVEDFGDASIGEFEVGDMVMIFPSSTNDGVNVLPIVDGQFEIGTVFDIDIVNNYLLVYRAQEGTVANDFTTYAIGSKVFKINKHSETSNLLDMKQRSSTEGDFLSVIIDKGYVVQQRQDYPNYIRLLDVSKLDTATTDTENNEFFYIDSNLVGKEHTVGMFEDEIPGVSGFRNGSLEVHGDITAIGGNITLYDSVKQTKLLEFTNDKGHADHGGELRIDASITTYGTLQINPSSCPELGGECSPLFQVLSSGQAQIKSSLVIEGVPTPTPTADDRRLWINNLGINGLHEFTVNADRSINSFGINNFYTTSGGRHARYLTSGSDDFNLIPNITYFVNVQSDLLVCYLPENAKTGDQVSIIEVGGNLGYNTMLILRASGDSIQGDNTGTTIGMPGTTPYQGGELVVQTPNAAFTLVYLGATDSNNQAVSPTSVYGWWLKEV